MQVSTLLQTDNHISTPPLSFLQAGCPSCRPTNSVKALKEYFRVAYLNKNEMGEHTFIFQHTYCHYQCTIYSDL